MEGKTVVITGATSGIGFETAMELAGKGARIVGLGRSDAAGERLLNQLNALNNNAVHAFYKVDLSSQDSIRSVAKELNSDLEKIDVLINNAAGVFSKYTESVEGIEMQWATNHIAYFLLSNLVLEKVKASPSGRIVNVSSKAHLRGDINWDNPELKGEYNVTDAYAQSKLSNVLFTRALARRLEGSGVTANCLHPGLVKTRIGNKHSNPIHGFLWSIITFFGISRKDGAETSVYLASSPEVEGKTGDYYDKCQIAEVHPLANDQDAQERLWKLSETYVQN